MAHFAELNSSNEVLQVIVVSNDDVNANGGDQHADAETFVASIVPHGTGGVTWKQTSYNDNFRKQYANRGYTYDPSKNKFIRPQPYASWSLDSDDDWKAPTAYPDDGKLYVWNETDTQWEEV
tara:strand:- start:534 stop:899 length:366 start_codon:yes stop_codon:yes gene_type:complete